MRKMGVLRKRHVAKPANVDEPDVAQSLDGVDKHIGSFPVAPAADEQHGLRARRHDTLLGKLLEINAIRVFEQFGGGRRITRKALDHMA